MSLLAIELCVIAIFDWKENAGASPLGRARNESGRALNALDNTDWWHLLTSEGSSFMNDSLFLNSSERNPAEQGAGEKKSMHKNTVFGIYYLDSRAPSCLSGVFLSFGVPRQSNSYSNSRVLARWDLLWRPSSSASIANEQLPAASFSCGLSAVCPPGKKKGGEHPATPQPLWKRRFVGRGPTAGC